jgi:nucleoside-diphosphate-sugar epimerase
MAKRRIAVLGASGQVAGVLIETLARSTEFSPVGLCRRPEAVATLRAAEVEAHLLCPSDPSVNRLLSGCDVVVNTVVARGPLAAVRRAEDAISSLFRALPGSQPLIHISSVSVYSPYFLDPTATYHHPRPATIYGLNKLWTEQRIWRQAGADRRHCLVVRLGHVYGAGQHRSQWLAACHRQRSLELPLDGRCASNCIHARSVAEALCRVLRSGPSSGIYNLVQVPQWSWRRVCDWHAQALQSPPLPAAEEGRSRALEAHLRRRWTVALWTQLSEDLRHWLASPGCSPWRACPALRHLARLGLRRMAGVAMEERLLERQSVRPRDPSVGGVETAESMLGDPAPGPCLECPHQPGPAEQEELRQFVQRTAPEYSR